MEESHTHVISTKCSAWRDLSTLLEVTCRWQLSASAGATHSAHRRPPHTARSHTTGTSSGRHTVVGDVWATVADYRSIVVIS